MDTLEPQPTIRLPELATFPSPTALYNALALRVADQPNQLATTRQGEYKLTDAEIVHWQNLLRNARSQLLSAPPHLIEREFDNYGYIGAHADEAPDEVAQIGFETYSLLDLNAEHETGESFRFTYNSDGNVHFSILGPKLPNDNRKYRYDADDQDITTMQPQESFLLEHYLHQLFPGISDEESTS